MNATRSAADAVAARGLGSDLLRAEASDLANENSRLRAAILSAVQHLERGRPSHALTDLTYAIEERCSYCGADKSEARLYVIPGVSCVECGAQSRDA